MRLTVKNIVRSSLWDLGFWYPDEPGALTWDEYLRTYLPKEDYFMRWVQGPTTNWGDSSTTPWHRDVSPYKPDSELWIALWCDRNPTQMVPYHREGYLHFTAPDEVFVGKPYQVLLMRNDRWLHRRAPMWKSTKQKRRFARAYVVQMGGNARLYEEYEGEPED